MRTANGTRIGWLAAIMGVLLAGSLPVWATDIVWDGDTDTTFSNGNNWVGGVPPAHSTATDKGIFGPALSSFQPGLTANRSINGLVFQKADGGWALGGTDYTLTLGTGGIDDTANTNGTTTFNVNISVGNNIPWASGAGGTIALNGTLTMLNANNNIVVNSGTVIVSRFTTATAGHNETKSGAGTLVLTNAAGANLTGQITISGGVVILGHQAGLGTGAIYPNVGELRAAADYMDVTKLANNALMGNDTRFGGSFSIEFGGKLTRSSVGGSSTITNSIVEGKYLIFHDVDALSAGGSGSSGVTFHGPGNTIVKGTYANGTATNAILTKNGTGTLTLSGNNTYSGLTTVNGGVLRLDSVNALPGGIGATGGGSNLYINGGVIGLGNGDFFRSMGNGPSQVRMDGGGGFAAYGADRVVNLGGSSAVVTWGATYSIGTGSSLKLGAADATHTVDFQNPIALGSAARAVQVNDGAAAIDAKLSGALGSSTAGNGLIKTGVGTLALTAINTYTGPTTVSNGTLLVNGALGAGMLTVRSGAALGGTGTVAAANLTLDSGSRLSVTVYADGTSDALTASGALNVNNVELAVVNTNLMNKAYAYVAVKCTSHTGMFASHNLPTGWAIDYGPADEIRIRSSTRGTVITVR